MTILALHDTPDATGVTMTDRTDCQIPSLYDRKMAAVGIRNNQVRTI